MTTYGTITINNGFQFVPVSVEPEMVAAGASGQGFNILNSNSPPPTFVFDFDVFGITFLYGGGAGGIVVEALDINGGVVASFTQAFTGTNAPAGPVTLLGSGIRSFSWNDTDAGQSFAVVDNIEIVATPEPGTALTGAIGLALLALHGFRRRKRRSRPEADPHGPGLRAGVQS